MAVRAQQLQAAPAAAPAPASLATQSTMNVSLGGQAINLPQTATPAALLIATGLMLLAIGGFVLLATRRRGMA
jgi:LPXTG-motif cell wall-anchored protein